MQVPCLIAMKLIIYNMMLVVPRKSGRLGGLAVSVMEYVMVEIAFINYIVFFYLLFSINFVNS